MTGRRARVGERAGALGGARRPGHLVARGQQGGDQPAADRSRCACEEDVDAAGRYPLSAAACTLP